MTDHIYGQLLLFLFVYFSIIFLIAVLRQNNSLVDIAWGFGFVLVSNFALYLTTNYYFRSILIVFLVSLWGVRLSYHLWQRNFAQPEDFRYANWRKKWRYFYLRSFLQIFMLQGILLFIIVLPVIRIISKPATGFKIIDLCGLSVFLFGLGLEIVADVQLHKFKQKSSNSSSEKILKSGVWKYSRHPNYFGEMLVWWGIFLINTAVPGGWKFIFSPLLISYLLLFVSGVPLLEKRYAADQEYQEYAAKTNKFFPWFPDK
jgi:steroid 5-alpha reductase family enzyme